MSSLVVLCSLGVVYTRRVFVQITHQSFKVYIKFQDQENIQIQSSNLIGWEQSFGPKEFTL